MKNFWNQLKSTSGQMWFYIIFSLFWVVILAIDYLNKEMIYGPSFVYFKYYVLSLFVLITAGGIAAYINRLGFFKRFSAPIFNGLLVFLLFNIFLWAITLSFNKYWGAPLGIYNFFHLTKMSIITIGSAFFLVAACYSVGNALRNSLLKVKNQNNVTFFGVDLSLGFMIYQFVLMAFGAYHLLDNWIMLGILSFMLLFNYKASWQLTKNVFWTKFQQPDRFGFTGVFVLVLLLFYLSLNYLYTQSPFPLGFDARNFYINISRLIGDADGLIAGFPPYSWGLIQATGYLLLDSPELTMFISTLGGILTLFVMYELMTSYLNIAPIYAVFSGLIFVIIPAITNHWMIEFKIDLALLFVQLSVINLLYYWMQQKNEQEGQSFTSFNRQDYGIAIVIGLIFGLSLAIKVLSIFLIFGLMVALWYLHKDKFGALGLIAASMGVVITIQLDEQSGMRGYHLSPDETGMALLILGACLLLFSLVQNNRRFLASVRTMSLIGIFALLAFSPWVYKNYTFTKSTSLIKLALGEKPEGPFHYWLLQKNYQKLMNAKQEANEEN